MTDGQGYYLYVARLPVIGCVSESCPAVAVAQVDSELAKGYAEARDVAHSFETFGIIANAAGQQPGAASYSQASNQIIGQAATGRQPDAAASGQPPTAVPLPPPPPPLPP